MSVRILEGDALTVLRTLPDQSVQMCVTSPPYYGLRDYVAPGQLGLEGSLAEFFTVLIGVFSEVRRVLRDDGTLWVNMGDSYNGARSFSGSTEGTDGVFSRRQTRLGSISGRTGLKDPSLKTKDLVGQPWRLAFGLQADGWYLRSDIIWHKPNPMPESVTDRPTKSHEYLFLLSKSEKYYYDIDAIREPADGWNGSKFDDPRDLIVRPNTGRKPRVRNDRFGGNKYGEGVKHSDGSMYTGSETRNKRSVWTVATQPFSEAHFATFPPKLIEPCILAGSAKGQTILDPFGGAGTTGLVADRLGRDALLIELNPKYAEMARRRIQSDSPLFGDVA